MFWVSVHFKVRDDAQPILTYRPIKSYRNYIDFTYQRLINLYPIDIFQHEFILFSPQLNGKHFK